MLLLENGVIADGASPDLYKGSILLDGDVIREVLPEGAEVDSCCCRMDLGGCTVAPGFVDAHSHFESMILRYPACKSLLAQGVTTIVGGNCGFSHALSGSEAGYSWKNLKEYIEVFNKVSPSLNVVALAGHNTLRQLVMGTENRAPSVAEMEEMKRLLADALEAGAAGLTFGLTYIPGKYSRTAELTELTSCLKGTGKLIAAHMRSEGDALEEALEEMFTVAQSASIPFHVSHIKTIFKQNFHKLPRMLELLEDAEKRGIRITADRYPYIYSSTSLRQILPPPYDLIADIAGYLKESESNFSAVEKALEKSPRDLPTTIILFGGYAGKTLQEISLLTGESMEKTACTLLKEAPNGRCAYLCMSEKNMVELIRKPFVACGSDGLGMSLDDPGNLAHPRSVGSLPKFFRIAADSLGVAEAVRKCSALPAEIFRIPDRGLIRKGMKADLVILEPEKVDSYGDYLGNDLVPRGIKKVFLAGKVVYEASTGSFYPGRGEFLPIPNK